MVAEYSIKERVSTLSNADLFKIVFDEDKNQTEESIIWARDEIEKRRLSKEEIDGAKNEIEEQKAITEKMANKKLRTIHKVGLLIFYPYMLISIFPIVFLCLISMWAEGYKKLSKEILIWAICGFILQYSCWYALLEFIR